MAIDKDTFGMRSIWAKPAEPDKASDDDAGVTVLMSGEELADAFSAWLKQAKEEDRNG